VADNTTLTYDPISGNFKSADGRQTLYTDELLPKLQSGQWSFANGVVSTQPAAGTTAATPTYDPAFTSSALRKLQSGQTLTNDERLALGLSPLQSATTAVATAAPITVPTLQNPLAPAEPTTTIPTLTNPLAPVETKPTVVPTMGGSLEDQDKYRQAIRVYTAKLEQARTGTGQQAGETRAQYETQIRKAGRDMYNSQIKALASLAARGITGAPGLSVAARRAGQEEPAYRRSNLVLDRDRQLSALQRTLAQQTTDYEEELRKNQEQLTRATTISNQLTGAAQ
jgi:hypothetical protein